MPLLAFLAAAAQAGDGVDAARFDPGENRGGEGRRQAEVEAAVTVEDGRPRRSGNGVVRRPRSLPVGVVCAARDDDYPDRRAVSGGVGDLIGGDGRDVHGAGSALPLLRGAGRGVVAQDDARRRVVGVGEPRLVAAFGPLGQAADRAEARQLELAELVAESQVVHGDLADRVPRPGEEQDRLRPGRGRRGSPGQSARHPRSSGISSCQLAYSGNAGSPGSATAIRPRGASRSVSMYSRPSRPGRGHVLASTPSCTT